ncbi:MAG: class I SAM-dependent methyltransferase [Candidatus Omnitrophica bacterium]|nr:class I SAM-dependent methyltransferase [Candidatus Omnitrophota bacterium]
MNIFKGWSRKEIEAFGQKDIQDFIIDGKFPYTTRVFFVQHLIPYLFFKTFYQDKFILEIGIGDGFGSFYLSGFSHRVVSLDMDFSCKDHLGRYIERFNVSNINFVNADASRLPFADESFDGVIACQLIEHIPEDRLSFFLQEINRVMKKKARALLVTLNVERNIKNPLKYEKFQQHHKEFTKTEFKDLLKSAFFSVDIFGLNEGFMCRFFLRLKRWGLMKYNQSGYNPVIRFYENILPKNYDVSKKITKRSIDLIGLCQKA